MQYFSQRWNQKDDSGSFVVTISCNIYFIRHIFDTKQRSFSSFTINALLSWFRTDKNSNWFTIPYPFPMLLWILIISIATIFVDDCHINYIYHCGEHTWLYRIITRQIQNIQRLMFKVFKAIAQRKYQKKPILNDMEDDTWNR